ncbi:MAG: 2-phospho-L-lactate transferase [Candidatus Hodarchaeaceae archaeon]|nr:2-phospho-L-lactate transferase [Candidatus Hodarchaeaceae archaeon]
MLAVLSGGTGTPKLLQGLSRLLEPKELSIVVNTGEDFGMSGIYISPDIDTVVYTLAGIVNEETWYGIRGDTFFCHEMLKRLGEEELLMIGDRDRAIKIHRALLFNQGKTLSEATKLLCRKLGIEANVMPMSDDRVTTYINTEAGVMTFHEFWVVRGAADKVLDVAFKGAEGAEPAPGVIEALEAADAILIGPSNPVTSIGPILSIKEIRATLSRHRGKVLAVSPIIGDRAVSGPAGALMQGLGYEVSSVGVAQLYRDFVGTLVLDNTDNHFAPAVEELNIKAVFANILMPDHINRVALARTILELAKFK